MHPFLSHPLLLCSMKYKDKLHHKEEVFYDIYEKNYNYYDFKNRPAT